MGKNKENFKSFDENSMNVKAKNQNEGEVDT